jgi:hypothetical protein
MIKEIIIALPAPGLVVAFAMHLPFIKVCGAEKK